MTDPAPDGRPVHPTTDDLDTLLAVLPPRLAARLRTQPSNADLLEIVLDLGRRPEARYPGRDLVLDDGDVTEDDLEHVVARVGEFGADNRAGIARTLHRISCIRNRKRRIVGLTCRVGRAVFGTIRIIEDLVADGRSILLLGRPGVGKTTLLREVARFLADEGAKRVIVVDTSNEIAGDADIPHPGIGTARRMQVPTPSQQHEVMIEAVENHMPEVIVIDEIGTELEAAAARTIAERGVQLIATAHGNSLENLVMNPTLSDLVGGVQSVILGDEEARRRGSQKAIQERRAPPTLDVLVEIHSFTRVAVHRDVARVVDALLRGQAVRPELRELDAAQAVHVVAEALAADADGRGDAGPAALPRRLFAFGVSRQRLSHAIRQAGGGLEIVDDVRDADAVVTLRSLQRRRPQPLRDAAARGLPVYAVQGNSVAQFEQCLGAMRARSAGDPVAAPLHAGEEAVESVVGAGAPVDLAPQRSYVRRLQHQVAQRHHLASRSVGLEPRRFVRIMPVGHR
jgi:stage III sporulation protein SpoIIIAA